MSKNDLRQKALELRRLGKSYSQIREQVKVSKSSLSLWLREYPLNREQVRLLRDVSEVRIEKYRQTMQAKRDTRFNDLYTQGKKKYLPLSKRELFIAGLFLYWGEGLKYLKYPFSLYNTNPQMIKFAILWYTKILHVPADKIKIKLHLYADMSIKNEIEFWSKQTHIPSAQFSRPYIKKSQKTTISYKGTFGHGTCGIVVHDVQLKERVTAVLKGIADEYGNKI